MAEIHFLDPGDKNGKPVLLIHGLGVDGSSWVLQFPALIHSGFRPIAIDVPGFGQSPRGNSRWNIQRVSRYIAEFLQENKLLPVQIVGLSMGGIIAQQLVFDFPQMATKLVLVNTFSVLRPTSIHSWMYFVQRFILVHTLGIHAQANFVAKRIFPNIEQGELRNEMIKQIIRADPRAYRAAMRSLGLFNSRDRLPNIKIPVLIITGEKDTTVLPAHQSKLKNWIPGSRQELIPDAGHAASIDTPDEFNRLLVNFLLE